MQLEVKKLTILYFRHSKSVAKIILSPEMEITLKRIQVWNIISRVSTVCHYYI